MNIFQENHRVAAEGMSTRALFKLLQDIAGNQCIPLHLTGPDLEKKGLMWVIIRYHVEIARWPKPHEQLHVTTWPGRARHGLMPRFYRICGEDGQRLIEASSVWAVVDRTTRTMVNNEDHGVHLDPVETGDELQLPRVLRKQPTEHSDCFIVPSEYLDENGHMNNTYYYAVAEQCIGCADRRGGLRRIETEHVSEALCGETLTLRWAEKEGLFYISGEIGDKTVFRMKLDYKM